MTYPYPYAPSPYGQPRTVGDTARWAGILMLIIGLVGLLMGGCIVGAGVAWPQLEKSPEIQNNPDFQRAAAEMASAGVKLEMIFYVMGAVMLVYAVVSIVLGIILIRARSKAPAVDGLVLVFLVVAVLMLFLIAQLVKADVCGAGVSLIGLMMHALMLVWLIQALRSPGQAMSYGYGYPPAGYYPPGYAQPMQGYQMPPQQQPPQQQGPPPGT